MCGETERENVGHPAVPELGDIFDQPPTEPDAAVGALSAPLEIVRRRTPRALEALEGRRAITGG